MNANELIGKAVYDTDDREYHITEILDQGGQGVVLRTSDGLLVKINTSVDKEIYIERYKWIIRKSPLLPIETRIAFPIALLKEPYVGYIMKEATGHIALENYVEKPDEIESFVDWYFNASGGLVKRLQIGYLLARSLRYLHINGYVYVDLSPKNVLAAKNKNSIVIIDSDNITSGVYKPLISGTELYRAPEVTKGMATVSSLTDTYSYAVLLFQMLTACHPYIGDDAEDDNPEKVYEKVDKGEYSYIGDESSSENKSSVFENSKIFLTDELLELFQRTFVDGKKDSTLRPSLMEFMKACQRANYKVLKCGTEGCDSEYYYYSSDSVCPVCGKKTQDIHIVKSKEQVISRGKILMPYDDNKEYTSLPTVTDDRDYMILKPEFNYIKRSFFDENIPFDMDKSIIAIRVSADNQIFLYNQLDKPITLLNSKLKKVIQVLPYIKEKDTVKNVVQICKEKEPELVIIDNNVNLASPDELIDVSKIERYYGETVFRKYLSIE